MTSAQAEALLKYAEALIALELAMHECDLHHDGEESVAAERKALAAARAAFLATVDPPQLQSAPGNAIHLDGSGDTHFAVCGVLHRAGVSWTTNPLSVTCPACKAKAP